MSLVAPSLAHASALARNCPVSAIARPAIGAAEVRRVAGLVTVSDVSGEDTQTVNPLARHRVAEGDDPLDVLAPQEVKAPSDEPALAVRGHDI